MSTLSNKKLQVRDGKRVFGDAWMEKRDDLYVLYLKGSSYEIGYQHGILMREEIKQGAVKFYADPINQGRGGFSFKNWLIRRYLGWKVYKPLKKSQPKEILDELKGIADGCGLPYKLIFKANHHTGVAMTMTPVLIKQYLKKFNKLGINFGACSTFVATKEATINGKTIVGRNTDYSGIERWPRFQTVAFVEPEDGYKYVLIGTAGMLLWAPGMNEKGIVLCGHYMIYDDITPNGWSMPAFTGRILRKAKNLDDAIEILNNNPRGISGGFVITDGKKKNAFATEVSTGKATIRQLEDCRLVMTNMAISEEKRKIDFVVKYNLNEGCPARYRRFMQLIESNYGRIDPSLAAEFMGDHIRITTGTERTSYGIIAVDCNVNSMVFSPEDLKFWVASGTAPVCNNPYIGFNFEEEIRSIQSKISPEILNGYRFKNQNKRLGMQKFNKAFVLFENNPDNVDNIINLIREASELDVDEVIYYQMIAKFLIHQGFYDDAISTAEKTLSLKQSLNEMAHNYLILGILNDLKGYRQKALSYYKKIENLINQKTDDPWFVVNKMIGAFTQKYVKNPFSKRQLNDRSVLIDFSQGAGIE